VTSSTRQQQSLCLIGDTDTVQAYLFSCQRKFGKNKDNNPIFKGKQKYVPPIKQTLVKKLLINDTGAENVTDFHIGASLMDNIVGRGNS
jgi:hypothetical protein